MTRKKTIISMASIGILLPVLLFSQSLNHLTLLAHYPLLNSANDTTGHYDPMELYNTPFQDGGIYCNGNYEGTDADACWAFTPSIDKLSSRELAVSVEFKVPEYLNSRKPVIVCGMSWRWQYIFLSKDSTIGCLDSGDFYSTNSTNTKYTPGEWHVTTLIYDSLSSMVKLYFDGAAIDSVRSSLNLHDDRRFTISHGGVATTFKGILRNLKIYSTTEVTRVAGDELDQEQSFVLSQNYPNPFNPETMIEYQLARASHIEISIVNLQGQEIRTLFRDYQTAGLHSLTWDGKDESGRPVVSGVYLYRLKTDHWVDTKKMLLIR